MTSIRTEQSSTAAERAQTFLDWTKINSRALTAGAVVVAVAAAGYWFYLRSRQIQAANAATALMTAKQSLTAGNMALAQSDLQKVFARYGSTSAGVEAAVLLAQVDFDSGKFQDGLSTLQKVSGTSAASSSEGIIRSLQGDGYAQMGKLPQAAKAYESAAQAVSGFDTEQSFYRAKAARTYQSAGDTAKARQIWTQLENDPKGQSMAAEARVRLGELTASVAKK
jgi:predicted negative regulator of RcsB-dependent stress response